MQGTTPCRPAGTDLLPAKKGRSARFVALFLAAALAGSQGCASLSSPVVNGVPVRRIPDDQLGESRENMQTIPLSLLGQPTPEDYVLAPGDVLGIWIEGMLGEKGQPPPVTVNTTGSERPAVGYPIPVRSNGTISLPLVPPIKAQGLTLEKVEDAIRKSYTVENGIIKAGRERVIVTLQRRREYHILVIRQDSAEAGGGGGGGGGGTGGKTTGFVLNVGSGVQGSRRGTGYAIDLPAYENDVLNALAKTGGFPGSDAVNEVVVERGAFRGERGRKDMVSTLQTCPPGGSSQTQKIRIPLRYRPGQEPTIRPEDVVLQTGDIVFIAARENDVFYTAGLLPAGEYFLPRDTDLDVVEAITRIGGAVNSGGLSTLNISGQLLVPGLGFPSPSLVSIVRKTQGGGQYTIRVDLNRALVDRRERILIQPRDLILLQERPEEAFARYLLQNFNFNFIYTFVNNSHAHGTSGFVGNTATSGTQ